MIVRSGMYLLLRVAAPSPLNTSLTFEHLYVEGINLGNTIKSNPKHPKVPKYLISCMLARLPVVKIVIGQQRSPTKQAIAQSCSCADRTGAKQRSPDDTVAPRLHQHQSILAKALEQPYFMLLRDICSPGHHLLNSCRATTKRSLNDKNCAEASPAPTST